MKIAVFLFLSSFLVFVLQIRLFGSHKNEPYVMIPLLHSARKRNQTTKDLKHAFFDLLTVKRREKRRVEIK